GNEVSSDPFIGIDGNYAVVRDHQPIFLAGGGREIGIAGHELEGREQGGEVLNGEGPSVVVEPDPQTPNDIPFPSLRAFGIWFIWVIEGWTEPLVTCLLRDCAGMLFSQPLDKVRELQTNDSEWHSVVFPLKQ